MWLLLVNQVNSMMINLCLLWKLYCWSRRRNVCKFWIFLENSYWSLINLLLGSLCSVIRMHIIGAGQRHYMNYKNLVFWIKSSSCKLFFFNNSTCLVVLKSLTMVYNLYLSSQLLTSSSTLFKMRKNIPKVTFILISTNRNISSKKQDFSSLSST